MSTVYGDIDTVEGGGTSLDQDGADLNSPKEIEWQDDCAPTDALLVATMDKGGSIFFIDVEIAASKIAELWDAEEDGPGFVDSGLHISTKSGIYPMSHFRTHLPDEQQSDVILVSFNIHSVAGIGCRVASANVLDILEHTRFANKEDFPENTDDDNSTITSGWKGSRWCLFGKGSFYPGYSYIDLGKSVGIIEMPIDYINSKYSYEESFLLENWLTKSVVVPLNPILRDGAQVAKVFNTAYSAIPLIGVTMATEFMVDDALHQQSYGSLFEASLESNIRSSNSMCWPIRISGTNYKNIIENIDDGGFLIANPILARLMGYVFPIVTYIPLFALNAQLLVPNALGTTLIGLMTLMAAMEERMASEPCGSITYYNDITDKSTIFNCLAYGNTEMMFSSQYLGFTNCGTIAPYYVISKSDYGLFTMYMVGTDDVNSKGGFLPDIPVYSRNIAFPEEYIYCDGWIYAKHEFQNVTNDNGVLTSLPVPGVGWPLEIELVIPTGYGKKTIDLYKDLSVGIPDWNGEDDSGIQLKEGLNGCLRWQGAVRPSNGPFGEDPEWVAAACAPLDNFFAKCVGYGNKKELAAAGQFLVGVSAEMNGMHRVLTNVLYSAIGYPVGEDQKTKDRKGHFKMNLYFLSLSTSSIGNKLKIENLFKGYQRTVILGGTTPYPSIHHMEENNISRYKITTELINSRAAIQCTVYECKYEINYEIEGDTEYQNSDCQILSINQLPFGIQHKTLAVITYTKRNDEGISQLRAAAITIASFSMTPQRCYPYHTMSVGTAFPQLHHEIESSALTLYSQSDLIRITEEENEEGDIIKKVNRYKLPGNGDHVLISDLDRLVEGISEKLGYNWEVYK